MGTMVNLAAHIEALKVYLDSMSMKDAVKSRIEKIENFLSLKKEDPAFPQRNQMISEVSFMVKNKSDLIGMIGDEKYFEVFKRAVKFLENNPEPKPDPRINTNKYNPFHAYGNFEYASAPTRYVTYRTEDSGSSWYAPQEAQPSEPFPDINLEEDAQQYSPPPVVEYTISPITTEEVTTLSQSISATTTNEVLRHSLETLTRALEAGAYSVPPGSLRQDAPPPVEDLSNSTIVWDSVGYGPPEEGPDTDDY